MEEKEILDIKKINIDKILNYGYNKADLFNTEEQDKIAGLVIDTYDNDKLSREPVEKEWKAVVDVINESSVVKQGQEGKKGANIHYPLIKQACKKWAAEAYPIVFQNGKIVKAVSVGNDDGKPALIPETQEPLLNDDGTPTYLVKAGAKIDKASRRVMFDNYIFNKKIERYEKNMDLLLYRLAIYGTFFKKIYYNSNEDIIMADIIFPQSIVVNNNALENKYTVYSQLLNLNVNDIKAKQSTGVFLDIDLIKEFDESQEGVVEDDDVSQYANYTEAPQEFIEQHRWLDLDNDGFLEPYIVVVHKDSTKLVGIYVRYTENDITRTGNEEDEKEGKIININAKQFFVKYDFLPTDDGTFYSNGFGHLLLHMNSVVNTLYNQLVDAGTLANANTGFISKALNQRAGNIQMQTGKYEFIDTFGVSLRDSIFPMPSKEPSIVLFELMQFILNGAKELVGNNPAFGQDMNPNLAPTTMMALVEEGAKEFKSIYKRVYRSLTEEIGLVEDIIRDEKEKFEPIYMEVLDDEDSNFMEDYNDSTCDIIPVSDVQVTTSFEKSQKATYLLQLLSHPLIAPNLNIQVVARELLLAGKIDNISNILITPPPAQPDPDFMIQQGKLQIEQAKLDMKKVEAENESYRAKIAAMQTEMKMQKEMAEGAIKAYEADGKRAKTEADIELVKTQGMKTYAETQKLVAETNLLGNPTSDEEVKQGADQLYEPEGI